MSMKQTLNTKSSTEAELVGCDNSMNMVVWTKLFMGWQTKDAEEKHKTNLLGKKVIIQQDNTAAIRMERFGKRSSTKRTRHLSIRYYYITNLLKEGFITAITYMPIAEMVSDYLTKPLQGSVFRKHRNCILGITEMEEAEALQSYKSMVEARTST